MNKFLTLLVLALTLTGFNSSSFATDEGAKAADTSEQAQAEQDKNKKKKGGDEEEPECE